ncbi:MAG: RNA polymerase sigma factor, partial [Limisphaerales bacterium]
MESIVNQSEPDAASWTQIAPLLDAAMSQLGEKDHSAIVLRFFEGKDMKQVGATLRVSENSAKTRVSRAVEKLRAFFAKRGITSSAAAIMGAVSANSVQAAPVGFASAMSATAATGSIVAGSTLALIKGTLKLMFWTKFKPTAIAGTLVLLAAAVATIALKQAPAADASTNSPEARLDAIKSFIANPPIVSLVQFEDPSPQEAEFLRTNKPAKGNSFGPFTGRIVGPYPYKMARWQSNGFLGMAFLTKEAMLTGQLTNAALAVGIYEKNYWLFNQTMGQSRVIMHEVSSAAGQNRVAAMVQQRLLPFQSFMRLGIQDWVMSPGITDRPPYAIQWQWQGNSFDFTNNNMGVTASGWIILDDGVPEINIIRKRDRALTSGLGGVTAGRGAITQIRYGYSNPPLAGLLPTTFDLQRRVLAADESWEPGRHNLPATNVEWEPDRHYTIFSLETTNQPMPMKYFSLSELASSNLTTQNFVILNNQYM